MGRGSTWSLFRTPLLKKLHHLPEMQLQFSFTIAKNFLQDWKISPCLVHVFLYLKDIFTPDNKISPVGSYRAHF